MFSANLSEEFHVDCNLILIITLAWRKRNVLFFWQLALFGGSSDEFLVKYRPRFKFQIYARWKNDVSQ